MPDIQSLIQKLESKDPDKRYDACEELRVMILREPLSQEAIEALHTAKNDSNPDVADAAQRALELHAQTDDEKDVKQDKTNTNNSVNWLLIGLLVGLIPSFMLSLESGIPYGILGFGGILGGVLGAYLGKRGTGLAIGGAVIGALLGTFLWFIFIIFTTLSG